MKRHRFFLALLLAEAATLGALLLFGRVSVERFERFELPAGRELVARLPLTDLALGTEARYTRHPSQADGFAPFQDLPSAIEHYPAGSIFGPRSGLDAGQEEAARW
jgi:hypothetical protein